jgi:two-component system OmpR family response regulator
MNEVILIVEDEPKIVKLARDYLEKSQFRVITATNGQDGLAVARSQKPDLVVLDLNLPGMDGLDVCRVLRKDSDVPIIMLTARADETDKLIGLEIGADDYITKPFSPRELVARVRVVLRRMNGETRPGPVLRAADIEIDTLAHEVRCAGKLVDLSRTEFNLLSALIEHAGQTLSREQLLRHIHGYAHATYDRSIDAHIKNLRRKIETDPADPRYIVTVFGVGYKFNEGGEFPA